MWKPQWEKVWGKIDTGICVAESLCCPPEAVKTLLIGYAPIQNKKFNNNKNMEVLKIHIAQGTLVTFSLT